MKALSFVPQDSFEEIPEKHGWKYLSVRSSGPHAEQVSENKAPQALLSLTKALGRSEGFKMWPGKHFSSDLNLKLPEKTSLNKFLQACQLPCWQRMRGLLLSSSHIQPPQAEKAPRGHACATSIS
jgi:hypothetical protein